MLQTMEIRKSQEVIDYEINNFFLYIWLIVYLYTFFYIYTNSYCFVQ